jgi:PAS domain-containing protein
LTSQAAISLENAHLYTDLQESEDRLRLAIDTIPAMVWRSKPDGSVEFYNRRFLDYTGLPPESAIGNGWQALVHSEDISPYPQPQAVGGAYLKPLLYAFAAEMMLGQPLPVEDFTTPRCEERTNRFLLA